MRPFLPLLCSPLLLPVRLSRPVRRIIDWPLAGIFAIPSPLSSTLPWLSAIFGSISGSIVLSRGAPPHSRRDKRFYHQKRDQHRGFIGRRRKARLCFTRKKKEKRAWEMKRGSNNRYENTHQSLCEAFSQAPYLDLLYQLQNIQAQQTPTDESHHFQLFQRYDPVIQGMTSRSIEEFPPSEGVSLGQSIISCCPNDIVENIQVRRTIGFTTSISYFSLCVLSREIRKSLQRAKLGWPVERARTKIYEYISIVFERTQPKSPGILRLVPFLSLQALFSL